MNLKKAVRQKRVIAYLENQLKTGIGYDGTALIDKDKARIIRELDNLQKNPGKKKGGKKVEQSKDKWFIDIYTVQYGYVKHSDRRKNKGKSRKGLKKTKNVSFIRSIVAQDGMITAYKDGRMGVSPKSHIFKLRKEEPSYF